MSCPRSCGKMCQSWQLSWCLLEQGSPVAVRPPQRRLRPGSFLLSPHRTVLLRQHRRARGGFFNIIFSCKLALMTRCYSLPPFQWRWERHRAAGARLAVGLNLSFVLPAQNGPPPSFPSECISMPCLQRPRTSTPNPGPLNLRGASFFFISSGCRILIMLIRGVYAPLYFRASFCIKHPLQSGRRGRGEQTVASIPYNIISCLLPAAWAARAQMRCRGTERVWRDNV